MNNNFKSDGVDLYESYDGFSSLIVDEYSIDFNLREYNSEWVKVLILSKAKFNSLIWLR